MSGIRWSGLFGRGLIGSVFALFSMLALAGPLIVAPDALDAGSVPPGETASLSFSLQNTGTDTVSFEFPGFAQRSAQGADFDLEIDDEAFGPLQFRAASDIPLTGEWSGFSGNLELLVASGGTWTNDLTLLFTSTPDLDFSAVVYQLGGNANYLAPDDGIIHWSGGVGNAPIEEMLEFPEPVSVDGLYLWVGNAWSAGGGHWNGMITLFGLGGQTELITTIEPAAGELAPGAVLGVDALFDAGLRAPGTYEEALILTTDHPEQAELAIPVRLSVPGQASLAPLPPALDFGEVVVGTSSKQTLALENTGNLALVLEQIAINVSAFSVDSETLEIAPSASATLTIDYTPTTPGADSAELSFSTNDSNRPQVNVSLAGTALPAPSISIEPAAISLSLASGDQTSASFDIVNSGQAALEFSLPAFADDDRPTVRMTTPSPSVGSGMVAAELRARLARTDSETATLPGWRSVSAPAARSESGYRVNFSDFSAAGGSFELIDGPLSGELSVVSADFVLNSATGQTFANDLTLLIASSPTPDLDGGDEVLIQIGGSITQLAPIVASWGTGNSSAPGTTVQSTLQANTPIALNEVYLLLGNSWIEGDGDWTGHIEIFDLNPTSGPIINASPTSGTVAAGETLTVEFDVSAVGLDEGNYLGLLQISSNDPLQPSAFFELALDVSGTPALALDASLLEFGELFIGQQRSVDLLISNTGSAALTVSDLVIDSNSFATDIETLAIAPGTSALVPVTFTASTTGTQSATLELASNDPDNPSAAVALNATVLEAPALVVAPATIDAAVEAGDSVTFNLSLSNPGAGLLEYSFPDFNAEPMTGPAKLSGFAADHAGRVVLTPATASEASRDQRPDAVPAAAPPATSPASLELLLEGFQANGGEFVSVGANINGELSRIDGDFMLEQAVGLTWANDLAVIITDGPELVPEAIVLQAGGTFTLGQHGVRLDWGMGSSSEPGTTVQTSLTLDPPLSLEGAHVWIGNAWVSSDSGQWSGLIGLDGVVEGAGFIIDLTPASGQIAPGDETSVEVTLSASELVAGSYQDRLRLVSNAPVNPDRDIAATLLVSGQPDLVAAPGILDFGEVFTGTTATAMLLLSNPGTDVLLIDELSASGQGFTVGIDELSIAAGGSTAVAVEFEADTAGSFAGELTISSNGPDPFVTIDLVALARNPGVLTTSESSLTVSVPAGATALSGLTLGNVGESSLAFTIQSRQGDSANPAAQFGPEPPASLVMPASPLAAPVPTSDGASVGLLEERELLWQQNPTGAFRITSSRSTELDAGLYAADRFEVNGAALVQGITAYGFRFDGAQRFDETFESVVFYLYEDSNGQPAGSPDDDQEAHLLRFAAAIDTPGFSVHEHPAGFGTRADVSLDLVAATGAGVLLPDGRYWLVVHAESASSDLYDDVWSLMTSFDGHQVAHVIDFDNVFDIGAEDWQPLAGVIPAHSANLAFQIEGQALNFLSVVPAQGLIGVDESIDIELLFDASDYQPGSYELMLVIDTNSPLTPQRIVPVTMLVTEADPDLTWVNLAGPPQAEISQGQSVQIHASAQVNAGRVAILDTVEMWVGLHDHDIHPALWPESAWVSGIMVHQDGHQASFIAEAGADLAPGEYRYATRFRLTDGHHVYGGYHEAGGGFWNGMLHVSGRLTVLASDADHIFRDRFMID